MIMKLWRLRYEDKNDKYGKCYIEGEAISIDDALDKGSQAAILDAKKDEHGDRQIEVLEVSCLGKKRF